jgi:hypothetical protein
MRGHPKEPHRLLCMVYRENRFIGWVIASADILQLPFRKCPGYSVRVRLTTGDTAHDLNNLFRRARCLRDYGNENFSRAAKQAKQKEKHNGLRKV